MPFLEHSVTIASVLTILAITVDRYNGICRPTSDNEWKRFKVWHILLVIWFVACASSLPMLFIVIHKDSKFRDGTPIKVCRTYINETWEIVYIVAVFCIYFVLILLVLAVLITKMTRSLLAQANLYEGQDNHRSLKAVKSRQKVVVMLLLVVLCFFLCLLPQRVAGIWFIFADIEDKMALGFEGYLNLKTFIRILMYLNSALNPVIYNSMSTKFRKVIITIARRLKRRTSFARKRDGSHTASSSRMTPLQSPAIKARLTLSSQLPATHDHHNCQRQRRYSLIY